jgi:hypothetical protein
MYPGDEVVDWLCLDGYNWGGKNWMSFSEIFRNPEYDSYARITALSDKPLMIGEMGSAEAGDGGRRKAAWITDALSVQIPSLPRIRAVIWFNEPWQGADFRIESSPRARRAFANAIADHRYRSVFPADILAGLAWSGRRVATEPDDDGRSIRESR